MNPNPHNPIAHQSSSTEETLRLIASLPAPDGLEDRVHAALRTVPDQDPQQQALIDEGSRPGRVLAWPPASHGRSGWMRTAAAAAIVFVVVGGGWGVYSRVQHGQPARIIMMPPHMPVGGGFSSAGAMRTPVTVPGPVLTHPATPQEAQPEGTKKPVKHAKSAETAGKPTAKALPAVQAGASK